MSKFRLTIVIFSVLFSGCAYVITKAPTKVNMKSYEYTLPAQWVRSTTTSFATKHGVLLEEFYGLQYRKKAKMPRTKAILNPDPEFGFKNVLDEIEANRGVDDFVVDQQEDKEINGHKAICVNYNYKDNGDLLYQGRVYIIDGKKRYFALGFEAPKYYYFEKYSAMLEEIVPTFKELDK